MYVYNHQKAQENMTLNMYFKNIHAPPTKGIFLVPLTNMAYWLLTVKLVYGCGALAWYQHDCDDLEGR